MSIAVSTILYSAGEPCDIKVNAGYQNEYPYATNIACRWLGTSYTCSLAIEVRKRGETYSSNVSLHRRSHQWRHPLSNDSHYLPIIHLCLYKMTGINIVASFLRQHKRHTNAIRDNKSHHNWTTERARRRQLHQCSTIHSRSSTTDCSLHLVALFSLHGCCGLSTAKKSHLS